MFSKPYEGVAYFGLWAEESADDWGASDALGLLRDAVLRYGEEDMRKDEIWAALDYLSARATRKASFRSFRKALDVENPVERYNAARDAYHAIGKQDLSDAALCSAVAEMKRGLFDADLGGGLFKKRVARPGQGKSGGYRTLIATNRNSRWVFVYGFAKNERSNIDNDEVEALKALTGYLMGLSQAALEKACKSGELTEVNCDA